MCWPVSDGHTVTAMMAEGCTLQHGFALQPFLIWLKVRDGSSGESLLCVVAAELEPPSVRGYKEFSAPQEDNAKGINTQLGVAEKKRKEVHC